MLCFSGGLLLIRSSFSVEILGEWSNYRDESTVVPKSGAFFVSTTFLSIPSLKCSFFSSLLVYLDGKIQSSPDNEQNSETLFYWVAVVSPEYLFSREKLRGKLNNSFLFS